METPHGCLGPHPSSLHPPTAPSVDPWGHGGWFLEGLVTPPQPVWPQRDPDIPPWRPFCHHGASMGGWCPPHPLAVPNFWVGTSPGCQRMAQPPPRSSKATVGPPARVCWRSTSPPDVPPAAWLPHPTTTTQRRKETGYLLNNLIEISGHGAFPVVLPSLNSHALPLDGAKRTLPPLPNVHSGDGSTFSTVKTICTFWRENARSSNVPLAI